MKKAIFGILLSLLLISPVVAQEAPPLKVRDSSETVEVIAKSYPEPYAISTNIVFVVDASSTINRYPTVKKKFNEGWNFLTQQFANDELWFRLYIFHDIRGERRTKWYDAGGPNGLTLFSRAKSYVQQNTGMRSWGLKAMRMALREKNPFDKNPATARRLTIVLFTDGGLSEAVTGGGYSDEQVLKSTIKDHKYSYSGGFSVVDKMIAQEQKLRVKKGLDEATIVTIGFKNTEADGEFGSGVKQRDPECQAWLLKLGKKYRGGNFLVRMKK